MKKLGTENISIGHVRYPTMGKPNRSNAQPLVFRHIKGQIAIAHNGNLINIEEILWKEHPVDADVIVGVPDSGLDAALGFSKASGIPYGEDL